MMHGQQNVKYWRTCILHHWRVIFVMSMEKPWNQP